jgi:uncharacterized protein YndB with AHSA1/START domain
MGDTIREATMGNYVARAEIDIAAPRRTVWEVLTSNGSHPEILFGAELVSDWRLGSAVIWRGEWQGKQFEDHGRVIELDDLQEPWRIALTHFSPLSGQPDVPENYHTLRYELDEIPGGTRGGGAFPGQLGPDAGGREDGGRARPRAAVAAGQ